MIRRMLDLFTLWRREWLTGHQLRRLKAAYLDDVAVSPGEIGHEPARRGSLVRSEIDTLL